MRYAPIIIIALAMIVAWLFGLHNYATLETLKKHQDELRSLVKHYFYVSVIFYMLIYITFVALSLPAATILTIIGGYLYGHVVATILVVLSASIGATILFQSVKVATAKNRDYKESKTENKRWLKKMRKGFQENAFVYLLSLRLMPIFPFVLINVGAGIFQIPMRTFFFGTLIGIIPGSFVYVSIGTAIQSVLDSSELSLRVAVKAEAIIALTGLGLLSLVPVLYKWLKSKKTAKKSRYDK